MGKEKSSDGGPGLDDLRQRIDDVDAKIHQLISERARHAQAVAIAKGGSDGPVEYYRPEREAQVLRKVVERNQGPLTNAEMTRLFREIMSACLAQEEPLKVAYLGPEGTFTQSAVYKHFGHSVNALSMATINEIFHEVESGVADFGIVPIENSTAGYVSHTLDSFLTSPLKICGEVELRIRQHLLGSMDDLTQVIRVCAHPQSLAQCRACSIWPYIMVAVVRRPCSCAACITCSHCDVLSLSGHNCSRTSSCSTSAAVPGRVLSPASRNCARNVATSTPRVAAPCHTSSGEKA